MEQNQNVRRKSCRNGQLFLMAAPQHIPTFQLPIEYIQFPLSATKSQAQFTCGFLVRSFANLRR
jgi:hypothetical protein